MTVSGEQDSSGADGKTGAERRVHPRKRTLMSGKIVWNKNQSVVNCTIRDLSETGAKLQVSSWLNFPKIIELQMQRGPKHQCEVVRVLDTIMGVRFTDELKAA